MAFSTTAIAQDLPEIQAGFASALERTAAGAGSCVPGADAFDDEMVHLVLPWRRNVGRTFGEYNEVVVRVSGPGASTLLLESSPSILWRIEPEDGARIDTVVVFGSRPNLVTGIAEDTRVFSLDFDGNGQPRERCDAADYLQDGPWWAFNREAIWLGSLSTSFERYAGRPIDSIVELPSETVEVGLGPAAVEHTVNVRRTGEAILEFIKFPVPEPANHRPDAPAQAIPADLSANGVRDWLLEAGLAIPATNDFLAFLCLREAAERKTFGIDDELEPFREPMDAIGTRCRTRFNWDAPNNFILLASIDVGQIYECPLDDSLTLYLPDGVRVQGQFMNCNVQIEPMTLRAAGTVQTHEP